MKHTLGPVPSKLLAEEGPSDFDRAVYQALAGYCFGEAECFPSQELLARDLGSERTAVCRAVGRLRRAGWLTVSKRRDVGSRWSHNVYALLVAWAPVPRSVRRAIVERRRCRDMRSRGGLHTNPEGLGRFGRSRRRWTPFAVGRWAVVAARSSLVAGGSCQFGTTGAAS